MSNVTFLGMGAMGARMAANLLKAGHAVTVWNRDPARTAPLAEAGARAAGTPAEAAREAEVVIAMVRDDDASRAVWLDPATGALAAMPGSAVAVESSTLTVAWARELAGHCRGRGVAFLDAPVAGTRPHAEAAQLIYFVGGEAATVEAVKPLLLAMGSSVHHAGPAGSGAAVKLAANALYGLQVAALGELIGLLGRLGVDEAAAVAILAATPVCSPSAKVAAEAMLAGRFAPMFPIELVEKDFGYVVATAAAAGAEVPLAAAARRVFAAAAAQGHGEENVTGVVQLYR